MDRTAPVDQDHPMKNDTDADNMPLLLVFVAY